MAYAPIALTIPQYDKTTLANWWLKFYEQGTTTPLSMATDAGAGTLLVKAELDSEGFPITAGSARFIPFIDGDYDLWCFPTAAEADANDTTNAIQFADNLNSDPFSEGFDTIALLAASSLAAGVSTFTNGYYAAGDGGHGKYFIVDPQAFDGFGDHQLANGNIAVLQYSLSFNAEQFGAKFDGVTDDVLAIQAALNAGKSTADVEFPSRKTTVITSGITMTGDTTLRANFATILKQADVVGITLSGGSLFNRIKDLILTGDGAGAAALDGTAATSGHGIHINTNRAILENVIVTGHKGNGFDINSVAGGNMNRSSYGNGSVVQSTGNDGDGFSFYGSNNNASIWSNTFLVSSQNYGLGIRCTDDFVGRQWEGYIYTEDNAKGEGYTPVDTGTDNGTKITGTHTGAANLAYLVDSTGTWTSGSLVGSTISNTTDGSSGTITDNSDDTIIATLTGGTDDDWDVADAYVITNKTVMTDSTRVFAINKLVGLVITNTTTTATATITANSGTTITATLSSGAWSSGNAYSIAYGQTTANYIGRLRFCDLMIYSEENQVPLTGPALTKDILFGVNTDSNNFISTRLNRWAEFGVDNEIHRGAREQSWNPQNRFKNVKGINVSSASDYLEEYFQGSSGTGEIGRVRYYGDGRYELKSTKTSNGKTSILELEHPDLRYTVWNITAGSLAAQVIRGARGTEDAPLQAEVGDLPADFAAQALNDSGVWKSIGGWNFEVTNLGAGEPGGKWTLQLTAALSSTLVDTISADMSTTSGHTRFFIYDVANAQMERVTVGASDSGGAGFKLLRIPN